MTLPGLLAIDPVRICLDADIALRVEGALESLSKPSCGLREALDVLKVLQDDVPRLLAVVDRQQQELAKARRGWTRQRVLVRELGSMLDALGVSREVSQSVAD